jgi:hypothetical protein
MVANVLLALISTQVKIRIEVKANIDELSMSKVHHNLYRSQVLGAQSDIHDKRYLHPPLVCKWYLRSPSVHEQNADIRRFSARYKKSVQDGDSISSAIGSHHVTMIEARMIHN